ncbi:MAG: hypothetical protein ACTS53_01840 [Candidatus Hodgkinia cicadicola]
MGVRATLGLRFREGIGITDWWNCVWMQFRRWVARTWIGEFGGRLLLGSSLAMLMVVAAEV